MTPLLAIYEVVYVTAITGATLTVVRAQEGTTAQNWNIGDFAFCAPTEGTVAQINGNPSQQFQAAPATSTGQVPTMAQAAGVVGSVRNLAMSVTAASASATLTADEIIVETALGGVRYCLPSFNKTINLATTGAGGMDTGSAPASGYVALYAIYNPTTGTAALLAKNATSSAQPNVYGGANMPAGYTASALLAVWPTNASSQFVIGAQLDRTFFYTTAVSIYNANGAVAAYTLVSAAGAVPLNARMCDGQIVVSNTASNATGSGAVAGSTGGLGARPFSIVIISAGQTASASFPAVPIVTPQTLYIAVGAGTGTPGANIIIQSFTI
jgi:hypothetical protein